MKLESSYAKDQRQKEDNRGY